MLSKLGNKSNAVVFDLIPANKTEICVESDLNVCQEEEVTTSEMITFASDRFIDLGETVAKDNLTKSKFLDFLDECDETVVGEIEERTRGQNSNPLWARARKGRITASNFHDVKCRKASTPSDKIVSKLIGDLESPNPNIPALKWGRKKEAIARKQYVAMKKLKSKESVKVEERGLYISKDQCYLGASPDGIVCHKSEPCLVEIKCPYKWRNNRVSDACKDPNFYCSIDENQNVQLKTNSRQYTQVQGQMGVCDVHKCDFVVYTMKDMKIITVHFDIEFWNNLLLKLQKFYMNEMLPKFISQYYSPTSE